MLYALIEHALYPNFIIITIKSKLTIIQKAKITIKSKLTIVKTTMMTMHNGKGEFLAWL